MVSQGETIDFGASCSTHRMGISIGRDPAIMPANALEVIVARHYIPNVGRGTMSAPAIRVEELVAFVVITFGCWTHYRVVSLW